MVHAWVICEPCDLCKYVNHKSKFTESSCELGSQKFGLQILEEKKFIKKTRETFVNHFSKLSILVNKSLVHKNLVHQSLVHR